MRTAIFCLLCVTACAPVEEGGDLLDQTQQAETINRDPGFIQVYVNNVENLEEPSDRCPGDWKDLLHYMDRAALSPDLFLVQQVNDRAQLDRVVATMNTKLHGTYAGIIADPNPKPFNSPCGPGKDDQTNAIIYRVGRFDPVGPKETWKAWRRRDDGDCERDTVARTLIVMHRFHDKLANKDVSVASLHWSTEKNVSGTCAAKNSVELDDRLFQQRFGGDLVIAGGDTNEPDRSGTNFRPWFQKMLDQKYTDAVLDQCREAAGATGRCLDENWTIGMERRIDFLFAKKGNGNAARVTAAHTISFEEADAAARAETGSDSPFNYSDHRAVRARVHY